METRDIGRSIGLAFLLLSMTGCSADHADTASRQKTEFEGSRFCQQYACRADGERQLDRGGLSRTYRIRGDDSVLVELQTWGTDLFSASIGLYGEERPRDDFPQLASEFFTSAIPECRLSRTLLSDLTRQVSDIMEGRPHLCGPWEVRAGRVGSDYIMMAER